MNKHWSWQSCSSRLFGERSPCFTFVNQDRYYRGFVQIVICSYWCYVCTRLYPLAIVAVAILMWISAFKHRHSHLRLGKKTKITLEYWRALLLTSKVFLTGSVAQFSKSMDVFDSNEEISLRVFAKTNVFSKFLSTAWDRRVAGTSEQSRDQSVGCKSVFH